MADGMSVLRDFVNNNKAYAVTHNGIPNFSLPPQDRDGTVILVVGDRAYEIDETYHTAIGTDRSTNALTFHSPEYESTFTLRDINLDDAKTAFPDSPRTYASPEDLEEKIAMALTDDASYQTEPEQMDTVSFTFDGDNALELIKVTEDGDMTYRDNGQWEEVADNENYPTIFDRDLIDIEPDDVDKAVAFWDANANSEKGVTKEQMLPFAALVQ